VPRLSIRVNIASFVKDAFQSNGAIVSEGNDRGSLKLDLKEVPRALRELL